MLSTGVVRVMITNSQLSIWGKAQVVLFVLLSILEDRKWFFKGVVGRGLPTGSTGVKLID
jgi:hypothetical protein